MTIEFDSKLKPNQIANWDDLPDKAKLMLTDLSDKHLVDGETGDLMIYSGSRYIARADFTEISGQGHVVIEYLYDKRIYGDGELYDINDK